LSTTFKFISALDSRLNNNENEDEDQIEASVQIYRDLPRKVVMTPVKPFKASGEIAIAPAIWFEALPLTTQQTL